MTKKNKSKIAISLFTFLLVLILFIIFINASKKQETIILATTTSTYDSGLLDTILPDFQEKYDIDIKVVSVGTGQAIKNGERGDVDVILVHAKDAEKKFVDDGFGVNRECVMYNDFILLGPKNDPANVKNMSIVQAFEIISQKQIEFISRGDDSGTHKKEIKIWKTSKTIPIGEWYKEIGSGMSDTIRMADEKLAYTLSDRGTYLYFKDKIGLVPLVQGDDILLNPYGVIAVNPDLHPNVNYNGAMKFISWLIDNETQKKIDSYKKNNEILFHALRGECI